MSTRAYDQPVSEWSQRRQRESPNNSGEQVPPSSGSTDNGKPAFTPWKLKSAWCAIVNPAPMREVVVEGLARRGEVVNLIASTKIGKSWLAVLLAFCVAIGRNWLGRSVKRGRVLYLDNELHDETIQNRLASVARELNAVRPDDADAFDYVDLRGRTVGIGDITLQLDRFNPGDLTLVIIDAKYRAFGDLEENSNPDQTRFHNGIDELARRLDCVIVLVHHATKGAQGGKDVTDVGSGGGAQSRTVDTHLVIRPHDDAEDLAVLDAAVRTFAPVDSQTLRFEFPLWHLERSIEPVLRQAKSQGEAKQEAKDEQGVREVAQVFAREAGRPLSRYDLHKLFGGSKDRMNRLLRLGVDQERFVNVGTRAGRNGTEVELLQLASDPIANGNGAHHE